MADGQYLVRKSRFNITLFPCASELSKQGAVQWQDGVGKAAEAFLYLQKHNLRRRQQEMALNPFEEDESGRKRGNIKPLLLEQFHAALPRILTPTRENPSKFGLKNAK